MNYVPPFEESPVVLIIDDNELMSEFLVVALERLGYPAMKATVEGALDFVGQAPSLRVMLCDIHLGSSTGPDLVRRALRKRPDLKVVFMTTGFYDISVRHTDALLNKPFDLQTLKNAIDSVLDGTEDANAEQVPIAGDRRRLAAG
jgi:CheY-like chemotaxis protein